MFSGDENKSFCGNCVQSVCVVRSRAVSSGSATVPCRPGEASAAAPRRNLSETLINKAALYKAEGGRG